MRALCPRRPPLVVLAAFILLIGTATLAVSGAAGASSARFPRRQSVEQSVGRRQFRNPVLGQGQDPSVVVWHGWYYFTQSSPNASQISVRRARSIKTLAAAKRVIVWTGGLRRSPCCDWWAPELHRIEGRWYIYTAADNGANANHRLQVLEAARPLGPYRYVGQLGTPGNHWSIDPSPLVLPNGHLYLFWSGWPGSTNGMQDIYIARLKNPTTITGPRVELSRPTYPWERHAGTVGVYVNESPEPIVHGHTVSVTYSASGCWTPYYSLGLLSAHLGADLMRRSSWTKRATPLFSSNVRQDIYGPASNGWFTSPNGKQTWIVFHAVTNRTGSCGSDRMVYAQPVRWSPAGTPELGGEPRSRARVWNVPAGDPGALSKRTRPGS